jgi:hypothetical protein
MTLRVPRTGIRHLTKKRDQLRHRLHLQEPQPDSNSAQSATFTSQMRFPRRLVTLSRACVKGASQEVPDADQPDFRTLRFAGECTNESRVLSCR